ncbi:MAG: radical SAM protein [Clostridia bacterium]|nr:radical SAM protein [Clostridia bacterium]
MKKISVILCNNMHMDIENANKLLTVIQDSNKNSTNCRTIETDYTQADEIIIITCAFGNGKLESLHIISDVVSNMRNDAKLIITGCMVKTDLELLLDVKEDALVLDFETVLKIFSENEVSNIRQFIPQNKVIISTGCKKKCSYCVYPNIADKYVSKPKEQILSEVERMHENETTIYITGAQETSDYGIDLYHKDEYNIANLAYDICTKYPDCNFVIGWFHPAGLTDEFISVLEKCKNIIEIMVHIQHASDHILKAMNRPKFSFTDERITKIKKVRPDIAISTEVIVGFPGETEADFLNLVKYLDTEGFDDIGVASYEQVANTPAAELPQIPKFTRIERMNFMLNRYKGSSSYPTPNFEESDLHEHYMQLKMKMMNSKGMILNPEARQKYQAIAGTDTELKCSLENTISSIYQAILNARDELEIKRVTSEVQELYTEEFRNKLFCIFSDAIKKPGIVKRFRRILL